MLSSLRYFHKLLPPKAAPCPPTVRTQAHQAVNHNNFLQNSLSRPHFPRPMPRRSSNGSKHRTTALFRSSYKCKDRIAVSTTMALLGNKPFQLPLVEEP